MIEPGGATSQRRGQQAEDIALSYLTEQGLNLVERNFRSRQGEIDLIMRDGSTLVFIEVRYRRSNRFGSPQESVTRTKQYRLLATAAFYLKRYRYDGPTRFDVAALTPGHDGLHLDWIKGAFDAG